MEVGVQKLVVEVVDARNLSPKDGHGTSSPYVILDFYGQRRKTRSVLCDLNPVWNDTVSFNVGKPSSVFGDMLEVDVYHDKNIGPTTRNNFLGRVRLDSRQFVKKGEEALIYYPLEKKILFSYIQGEIGLKIYFSDEVVPPPPDEVKSDPPPETGAAAEAPTDLPPPSASEQCATDVPQNEEVPPPADTVSQSPSSPNETGGPPPAEAVPAPPSPAQAKMEPSDNATADPDQLMENMASASIPEVKVSGIYGPCPISRAASVSSVISDASDNVAGCRLLGFFSNIIRFY